MNKKIRTSKLSKIVACYLVLMIFLEMTQPMLMFALTEGPSQPEFNSFTPIGTSDMVDLASGDFSYNIPIMDVGGYPINLAYNSGVTMDQEASWVGLGWNLNIGQINRNVRGLPDDFKGDEIETQNNLKPNVTVSVTPYINPQAWGMLDNTINVGAGLEVKYNNYTGLSANPTIGASFNLARNVSLGVQLSSSDEMGATISPSVSLTAFSANARNMGSTINGKLTAGISYNSRQGLQSFNLSSSVSANHGWKGLKVKPIGFGVGGSSSISFNDATFTPTKRTAFTNTQFTFSFSGGPSVFGVQAELSLSASASIQKIKDEFKLEKAYGYENTEFASEFDLLDFNRENELGIISKNTNVLPVTNYTYDVLTVQSQGLNGTIRPYRGQIGYVYDSYVADESSSTSMSAEIEAGWGIHYGASIKNTSSINYTSGWKTIATPYLKEKPSSDIKYEKVYYKSLGELRVDPEFNPTTPTLFSQIIRDDMPVTLKLMDNEALNKYSKKVINGYDSDLAPMASFNSSNLRRTNREMRNTAIQKITKKEALDYHLDSGFVNVNPNALNHHTAGFMITDENGNRNVFGETAYNIEKKEVTFATDSHNIDCVRGIVKYGSGIDGTGPSSENGRGNSAGIDHYFNSIKTKQYAHTYLISSILSPDYQDINGNGPTDDDLGNYTKFSYTTTGDVAYSNNYKWRVPYGLMEASYNEGLKTATRDQKASYLYGVKEIKYLKRIETKTHVALIDLEERLDGYGTINENGGLNTANKTYCIRTIRLYAKRPGQSIPNNISLSSPIKPIKTAHFEYDYSLCQGIENNGGPSIIENGVETNHGKLTLKKVYFTYKGSNMGKYTPYEFVYDHNKAYNPKNYDIWGNYKQNPREANGCNALSTQDFPYVQQTDKDLQDETAAAWSLEEVKLPSGGKIKLTLESDDYQYVQNKKAMQMFKVLGVTNDVNGTIDQSLYTGGGEATFVVVKVDYDRLPSGIPSSEVLRRCTEGLENNPIYFDFLLNMTSSKYDHVTGYFEMDGPAQINSAGNICIPMRYTSKEGGGGAATSNPISVAGWFFGRQNLHRQIYGLEEPVDGMPDLRSLATSLIANLDEMIHIFTGPNQRLKGFGCANNFIADKSWIRLNEPTGSKLGGGLRVKKLEMYDGWDEMLGFNQDQRYQKKYGQEYSYTLGDNEASGSSGVATYEANMSKENPLVQPLYNGTEKLSAQTYEEKPFGACFFPSPLVTYSKVRVKNITAADDDQDPNSENETRKTRSGTVVTYHYTSYDFPTKTDFTDLSKSKSQVNNEPAVLPNILLGMFGLSLDVRNELTLTQGFQIETNDMNGKVKKQEIYDDKNDLISYVENIYSTKTDDLSSLNNTMSVINPDGRVSQKTIGVNYDVVNDLRYNYNYSNTSGVNGNLEIIPIFAVVPWILYIPTAFFDDESHYQIFRSAVTTKVIHKTGILKEKIAYDLGSQVSTKNLAWDSETGQVLLTQTANEFDDSYYNLNLPAYWHYKRMGMATNNADVRGTLTPYGGSTQLVPIPYFKLNGYVGILTDIFELGDELYVTNHEGTQKVWVFGYNANGTGVLLMDSSGEYLDMCGTDGSQYSFRILRSGFRNSQMSSMASITSMVNPIETGTLADFLAVSTNNTRIVNATAIEYEDFWAPQNERTLALYQNNVPALDPQSITFPNRLRFNPFYQNYKGNWRPVRSLAYLTGRKALNTAAAGNPRYNGFFSSFSSFYNLNGSKWIKNGSGWTAASEVTKYNPHGVEIENRDALGRYSSAQYGYNYTKPFAVVNNAEYKKAGFDNFEDYPNGYASGSHFEFETDVDNKKITTDHAHTGKNSIMVAPGQKAELKKRLFAATITPRTVNCIIRLPCPLIHQNDGTEQGVCWNIDGQLGFNLIIGHITGTIADGSPLLFASTSNYEYMYNYGNRVTANAQASPPGNQTPQICFWPTNGNGSYEFYFRINYVGGSFQDVIVPFTISPSTTWGENGPLYNVVLGAITTVQDCGDPQVPVQED